MKPIIFCVLITMSLVSLTSCCGDSAWWQSIGQCSACDHAGSDWS